MQEVYVKLKNAVPFFADLPIDYIADLMQSSAKKTFNKDKEIYRSGYLSNEFYIIISGSVMVTESDSAGEYDSYELTLGGILGLDSFILNKPYADSAVSTSDDTLLLVVNDYHIRKSPKVGFLIYSSIAKSLSENIREKNKRLSIYSGSLNKHDSLKKIISNYQDSQKDFKYSDMPEISIADMNFDMIDFNLASFIKCDFKSPNINATNATLSDFSTAQFDSTSFRGCFFEESNFTACYFESIIFANCIFSSLNLLGFEFNKIHIEEI